MIRRSIIGAALALFGWGLAAGCGDDAADTAATAGSGGTGAGTGGGGFSSGSNTGGFESCAEATVEGERLPVQMYIMFDKSQSMLEDQKWAGATAALIAFFRDEDTAGLNVALRFFPDDTCDQPACDVNACATPLVPLGELNAQPAYANPQQELLETAVESRSPSGQTPMYAALAGAEQFAVANAVEGTRTAVVLVTDGAPNGCEPNPDTTASYTQLAADALANAGVLTYTVGMDGADIALLEALSTAGGTTEPFVVGSESVNTGLAAALRAIGTAPITCTLPMPAASGTDVVDPNQVNVSYDTGDGEEPVTIPRVDSAGQCDADGGWYYDNAAMPTQILLCPASCDVVSQAPPGAAIQIILGCATIVK